MHPQLNEILENAENRYLKPEELGLMTQYIGSLPERLETYRTLRDRELEMMQWVADQLQAQLPQEKQDNLERCIKNALLMLRHCSMAMLLNDETFVKERFISWVSQSSRVYNTENIDQLLYRLLNQQLTQKLNAAQMDLLRPMLTLAQSYLSPIAQVEPVNGVAIGW
jgi:hypothetical protein